MLKPRTKTALALAVIAIAAGVSAYVVSRELLVPEPAPSAPPQPDASQRARIPETRPNIQLRDRDGELRTLAEWDGKPLVVNFWATWCAPCRREMPMLNQLAKDLEPSGAEVVGVAIDFREDVLEYLETMPVDYTVLIGEQDGLDAARDFGVENVALPFTAFIDSKGRIATLHMGELHRPQADVILSAVAAVDAGALTMPAARARIAAELAKLAPDPG